MVRRTTPSLPQPAVLTAEQIRLGIKRLSARLEELRAFEPTSILDRSNCPELTSLKAAIEDAIVRTFGRDTSDYQLYRNASFPNEFAAKDSESAVLGQTLSKTIGARRSDAPYQAEGLTKLNPQLTAGVK